jgi:hypothetical protein
MAYFSLGVQMWVLLEMGRWMFSLALGTILTLLIMLPFRHKIIRWLNE